MKYILFVFLVGVFAVLSVQTTEMKRKVDNFSLEDYNKTKHSLTDFKSSKAIVLMFIATQCPVSNDYNKRMAALNTEYSSKGVAFIGINSNKQETIEEIKEHAQTNGFTFPILKDKNNVIADRLNASVTPEIFVLNSRFEVLYHGRIDDSRKPEKIQSQDLRSALDAVLSNKPVPAAETKAFGCTIKRIE